MIFSMGTLRDMNRGVGALRQDPGGGRVGAHLVQDGLDRDAHPLARAEQPVQGLGADLDRHALAIVRPAPVSGALEKVGARHRRVALEVRHREDHRALDHPVHQQLVTARADVGDAGVMALEVQIGRRDGALQLLQRGARRAGEGLRASEPPRPFLGRAHAYLGREAARDLGGIVGRRRASCATSLTASAFVLIRPAATAPEVAAIQVRREMGERLFGAIAEFLRAWMRSDVSS